MQFALLLLATGLGSGRIPFAPGTFGSLIGLPIGFLLSRIGGPAAFAATAVFCGGAIWIAGRAEEILQRKDPPAIVIDEIAGMAVGLAGLAFTPFFAIGGFVLFRVFDILKPFPARWIDRRVAGGAGIVLDDVVAGVYTNLILRLAALCLTAA
jgi:phosphatidylglycerophosphatase A